MSTWLGWQGTKEDVTVGLESIGGRTGGSSVTIMIHVSALSTPNERKVQPQILHSAPLGSNYYIASYLGCKLEV